MNSAKSLHQYISSFETMLIGNDFSDISEESYCVRYLNHILSHSSYFLKIYAEVLEHLLMNSGLQKEEIHLLDYGAGNGLLGIFAKYCGFEKVYINDVDADFLEAAKNLSTRLSIEIDGFILGDIKDVLSASIDVNAIAGTDVIEHDDLNDFMMSLKKINPQMVSVFTTASNPDNFFKVRQLKKIQLKDEWEGGAPGDAILFGSEPHEPFIKIREKIINATAPNLGKEIIENLAALTRGMNRIDIEKSVRRYEQTGTMPTMPSHPTNTCHPDTGSWTERILEIKEYKEIYEANNFKLKVLNGYYDTDKKGLKKIIHLLLNQIIAIFGKSIAPFIFLVGNKK